MISFHPTVTPFTFLRYLFRSRRSRALDACLRSLFPEHRAVLVDSGRSAFACTLDALGLRGATILMPAYVCDAFYPILSAYDITPVFLDIDPETYQPPQHAYTDELLAEAGAVLLVATYGRLPDERIVSHLNERGATIIEDHAMRSPLHDVPLRGTARIYSLPKTLPVPDGGLAVFQSDSKLDAAPTPKRSSASIKNTLKLLPVVGPMIAYVRGRLRPEPGTPAWSGAREASALTRTILLEKCELHGKQWSPEPYTYCVPLRTSDPTRTAQRLLRRGVSAERIWNRPIVANPDARERYQLDPEAFPETMHAAAGIVCAPLWHIKDEAEYREYTSLLQKVSAGDRGE